MQVLRKTKEGLRILRTRKGMLGLVLVGSPYTLALMPTSASFPPMTTSYLNRTNTSASIAEVVLSAEFLVGSLMLSKWGGARNRAYTIVGSFLLVSFGLFVSGILSPDGFYVFILCSWLMGVSGPSYWGMYMPLLQNNFEVRYLGRVLSLSSSTRLLNGPPGLIVSGILAKRYGIESWFLTAGVLVLTASILCVAVPSMRVCDEARILTNKKESE